MPNKPKIAELILEEKAKKKLEPNEWKKRAKSKSKSVKFCGRILGPANQTKPGTGITRNQLKYPAKKGAEKISEK